jgi:hypothetical protein
MGSGEVIAEEERGCVDILTGGLLLAAAVHFAFDRLYWSENGE